MEDSGSVAASSVAMSERLEWLSRPRPRREPTQASPSYYNVAEAWDACYKKNKPRISLSRARGTTRLELEEAALERRAARERFGWDADSSGRRREFTEPLRSGAGGPRGRVGNQGRDPRAPPVGRTREIAENIYNSDAMYNPGPADFECNAHKPFGQKIDGRPWFYSKYSPAGLEALHAARNSGRWNGGQRRARSASASRVRPSSAAADYADRRRDGRPAG
jgi:hypothetical protein